MKRLFIAIHVNTSSSLTDFTKKLKHIAPFPAVKWVDPEQYHLTLKFLGDFPENNIRSLISILKEIAGRHQSFDYTIKGAGYFTNRENLLKVLWAGIKPSKPFLDINKDINTALEENGFSKNHDHFKPHLTLGRIKKNNHDNELIDFIYGYNNFTFVEAKATNFVLIESKLTRKGPVYKTIQIFNLQ
ncbi:MAG: RNA 2',3'-cyclic phosphodiesterase [Bacteroidales bacterium]|nr:RNA 2',3'-cyclic phosphodiesterase [Bacteroidales bacterium]